ncbi:MAG TPA: biopolymer transporter ExbD [Gammaproteobacteria bacterium]|nr:biopolymer transporter ExbD [Gammaproteobacteria bacterium]
MNFRKKAREDLDLNLTPLIDVVFLLLIFFMVSTTFQKEAQLEVNLPEATREAVSAPDNVLEIAINTRGQYFLNGRELTNNRLDTLRAAIAKMSKGQRDTPLVIRADAQTPHQAVVTAMDAAAQLGMLRLSIATSQNGETPQ